MSDNPVYGFLDESPNLGGTSFFFCVAIILPTNPNPKHFEHIFKKIRRRKLSKKKKQISEIKFANSEHSVRVKVLELISHEPVTVSAFIINREKRKVFDTPENYGIVVGFAT